MSEETEKYKVEYPPYRVSKKRKDIMRTMSEIRQLNQHKRKPVVKGEGLLR